MTNVLRFAALATVFAMTSVLTTPAFAGGGSTKSDPELTIENDLEVNGQEVDVYVKVVTQGQELAFQDRVANRLGAGAATFADAFTAEAGSVLEGGEELELEVKKGRQTILFADADAVDAVPLIGNPNAATQIEALFNAGSVNVRRDATVQLSDF